MRTGKQGAPRARWPAWPAIALAAACSGDGRINAPVVPDQPKPTAPVATVLQIRGLNPNLQGMVNTDVSPGPSVLVTNQNGKPAAGKRVNFASATSGAIATTDSNGVAAVDKWRLPALARTEKITAWIYDGPSTEFTAVARPGAPAIITSLTTQSPFVRASTILQRKVSVLVTDAYGNAVSGARVQLSVLDATGAIDSVAISDSLGVATAGQWTLGPLVGVQRAQAELNGIRVVFSVMAFDFSMEFAFARNGQIFRADADGTQVQLTFGPRDYEPAWSPDGEKIAFTRWTANIPDVYVMNADGTGVTRVTYGTTIANDWYTLSIPSAFRGMHSATWSRDGRRLVAATDGVYWGYLYLLDPSVSGGTPVLIASDAAQPSWSPRGDTIAFVGLSGDDGYHTISTVDVAGTGIRDIVPRDNFGSGMGHPSWSPDGQSLAFTKCTQGFCGVYTTSLNGAAPTLLTTNSAGVYGAAWSPAGDYIAYVIGFGNSPSVAVIAADGSKGPFVFGAGSGPAWRPRRP